MSSHSITRVGGCMCSPWMAVVGRLCIVLLGRGQGDGISSGHKSTQKLCIGREQYDGISMVIFYTQSEDALMKARERLEFGREMMLIPRNLAGKHSCLCGHMTVT